MLQKSISHIGFFSKVIVTWSIIVCAFCLSTGVKASLIPDHIVIEKMLTCRPTHEMGPSHIIFDQNNNSLYGWSHIFTDPDAFPGLTLDYEKYRVDETNTVRDRWCRNLQVHKSILVKKYADWNRQHANGLVSEFPTEDITFGNLKDIVLELKINSGQTFIPNRLDYLSTYGSYTDIDNLLEMDQGKVNLGITIYGENDADQSIETFQGMINLELDQVEVSGQWLRIVIPAESLWYYVQKEYANTEKDIQDYLSSKVVGLRVTPETRNTKVLRNYIPDVFNDSIPESYKEVGISIRKLAVRLKENGSFWWGENPIYFGGSSTPFNRAWP